MRKLNRDFDHYKTARNKVTAELKKSKFIYEKSLAENIKTNNKLFWKHVRSKTKTKGTVVDLQTTNGEMTKSDIRKGKCAQ